MLSITIPGAEYFDEINGVFVNTEGQTIQLEHSLISLSKWESKWHKPFLGREKKTREEEIDYIRCMTITKNVDTLLYYSITPQIHKQIKDYIDNSMTATWFTEKENKRFNREVITAEIIYYWMVSLQIPFECEKWHLNRLLTLIRVCNEKNAPEKKMSKRELLARNRSLNEARRKKMHSKG